MKRERVITILHNTRLGYLSLLPGLATAALIWDFQYHSLWFANLNGAWLTVLLMGSLAITAVYLTFIIEVLPFPNKLIPAILMVGLVPAELIIISLVFGRSPVEVILITFITETLAAFVAVIFQIIRRIFERDILVWAIVLLLAIGAQLGFMAWPVLNIINGDDQIAWAATGAIVFTAGVQYFWGIDRAKTPKNASAFVVIGVFGWMIIPLIAIFIRSAFI